MISCKPARNCTGNLLRSQSPPRHDDNFLKLMDWEKLYLTGSSFDIYNSPELTIASSLGGKTFSNVAALMYKGFGVFLIGIEIDDRPVLNPGNMQLKGGERTIILAQSYDHGRAATDYFHKNRKVCYRIGLE